MTEEIQKARISVIQKKYEAQLLKYPNVVGVGIGYKTKGGVQTKELCITVLVEKKLSEKDLDAKDIIPKELEGVKTDVIETGKIGVLTA